MRWDPARYAAFGDERSRPFHELVAQVGLEAPRRVVDLGCGPGTLTATLAARWRESTVVGIDSSAEMLASVPVAPNLAFELGAIEDWTPGPTDDVVVTNAALQWVPSHVSLLPQWLGAMPSGSSATVRGSSSRTPTRRARAPRASCPRRARSRR